MNVLNPQPEMLIGEKELFVHIKIFYQIHLTEGKWPYINN